VLASALWLTVVRRRSEAAALVAGFLLVFVSVHLAKAGIERPRPGGALAPPGSSSYPSGHAAYAVTYVALALVAARGRVGAIRPTALVGAGAALAALVGLTRVYLRVHYISDVIGGLALGVGIYALCAATAIVAGHLLVEDSERAPPADRGATLRAGGTGT
jgi:undecaprenyl-diphosphatase